MSTDAPKPLHSSVILVHGIRTYADWYQTVKNVLQTHGYNVHPTNYGYFDLIRFLLPFEFIRNGPKNKVFRQIREAKQLDQGNEFSIIAHSFGTYIVSRILQDEFDIQINRIIFTGSVVRYDFPFEQFSSRFHGAILNDVAPKDPWPAIAESITTGYGSAGTFGFRRPRVVDRWNEGGHSTVLNAPHCEQYWIPFLNAGTIIARDHPSKVPFWIRLINIIRIKYIILAAFILGLSLYLTITVFAAKEVTVQMFPGSTGWQLSDNDLAASVNSEMDKVCPLGWLLGRRCDGWLARYITKRSWRGIHRYDHRLNDVLFPDTLVYTYRDPEKFWFHLSEIYPNCILITPVGEDLEITLNKVCNLRVVN